MLVQAAQSTYDGATSEEARAEHQYDTRALEASYLAGAQARRAGDMKDALMRYKSLAVDSFDGAKPIALTALIQLESDGSQGWYFMGPCSGGLKVEHQGETVVVITPSAPLGRMLLGRSVGDSVTVGAREYEVIEIL